MRQWTDSFKADVDRIFNDGFLKPTPHLAALAGYLSYKLTSRELSVLVSELTKRASTYEEGYKDGVAAAEQERTEA